MKNLTNLWVEWTGCISGVETGEGVELFLLPELLFGRVNAFWKWREKKWYQRKVISINIRNYVGKTSYKNQIICYLDLKYKISEPLK